MQFLTDKYTGAGQTQRIDLAKQEVNVLCPHRVPLPDLVENPDLDCRSITVSLVRPDNLECKPLVGLCVHPQDHFGVGTFPKLLGHAIWR